MHCFYYVLMQLQTLCICNKLKMGHSILDHIFTVWIYRGGKWGVHTPSTLNFHPTLNLQKIIPPPPPLPFLTNVCIWGRGGRGARTKTSGYHELFNWCPHNFLYLYKSYTSRHPKLLPKLVDLSLSEQDCSQGVFELFHCHVHAGHGHHWFEAVLPMGTL